MDMPNCHTNLIFHFTTLGPKIVKCTQRCIYHFFIDTFTALDLPTLLLHTRLLLGVSIQCSHWSRHIESALERQFSSLNKWNLKLMTWFKITEQSSNHSRSYVFRCSSYNFKMGASLSTHAPRMQSIQVRSAMDLWNFNNRDETLLRFPLYVIQ